jgi:hypothetical protein
MIDEKADPEPGSWADVKRRRAEEKAAAVAHPYAAFAAALTRARNEPPAVEASAAATLDMVEAALKDSRLSLEALRETLAPLIAICPRAEPDAARARHIKTWLDMMAASWAPSKAALQQLQQPSPDDEAWPPPPWDEPVGPAGAVLKAAIEGGNVVQLPSGARIQKERPL